MDAYYAPGTIRAFAPGRFHYHFKWAGSYFSVDTACSASLTAISLACAALKSRECDTAVAGGANILASPEMFVGLKNGGFLSGTGACNSFRADADGYCRAEAVGVIVLKRLEDAVADNDNIQAVTKGVARNYNAHAKSITQPDAVSPRTTLPNCAPGIKFTTKPCRFRGNAWNWDSSWSPIEMGSVTNVFGRGQRSKPLYVGAVKANIGHSEAVS